MRHATFSLSTSSRPPRAVSQLIATICAAAGFLTANGFAAGPAPESLHPCLLDPANLARAKALVAAHDPSVMPAYEALIKKADEALAAPLDSVVDKLSTPPSGDKHDYMSLAPYSWPDPTKPDGLPYISRDGQRNPEVNDDRYSDSTRFLRMAQHVEDMALAYYFTGDEKYADRDAQILRTFFLEPKTAMNPNLNFGQAVKGGISGRGNGLIETRYFIDMFDSIGLLSKSKAWTADDDAKMKQWAGKFMDWMAASPLGKDESNAANNHGTYYDAQYAALAMYIGKKDEARKLIDKMGKRRIAEQIAPDGSQPDELKRTRPWHYTEFNLEALFALATLADRVGVDMFHYKTDDGRSMQKALDFAMPYMKPGAKWPYKDIDPWQPGIFVAILRQAALIYNAKAYTDVIANFPQNQAAVDRSNLLYPPK